MLHPRWFSFLSATNFTKLERLHRAASRAITGCLSSSPIPLLLIEASLYPLQVTLFHFTLSSYVQALCLPTSFPISGLARLGVRPRLHIVLESFCVHSPAYASTCSREALLACPPCPPWNLPSFTVESTLTSPCSRSDPPLSRQGAALAHLDSLPLIIWCFGQTALFLFLLARAAPAFLPTVFFCGTEATLFFSAGPVCSSFSAEACAILHVLCWSRQHQQVCHFSSLLLLSDSCSVLDPSPLLHLSSYLKLCGRSGRNCLLFPPVLSDYNGSLDTRFSLADELARRGALLAPSTIPCSLSFISRIHFWFFSDWRRTVSSKFFGTQVSSISTEELVLPRHARCVLSRLRCNGHGLLLGSYLFRIGRIENPSCSAFEHSS